MLFKNKKIVLGISGGIAAYKSVELLRLLVKKGADVQVVMTKNSCNFVTPLTFQTLSGNPVLSDTFEMETSVSKINHIDVAAKSDLLVVVPATANIIGKFASGIADDLLTTIFLCVRSQILIAPAMNHKMYAHPIVQQNILKLKNLGIHFKGPEQGELACGEDAPGRVSEPKDILTAIELIFSGKRDLTGLNILITAGPTREYIDPVRYLSNSSSGKMGYEIAREALKRGGNVTLISGPVSISAPEGAKLINITSTSDLRTNVLNEGALADIIIMAAAVGDFSPAVPSEHKIKKRDFTSLDLKLNPDILVELRNKLTGKLLVGFAAETENLLEHAKMKLTKKNLDIIVANNVGTAGIGFGSDYNEVTIIEKDGTITESGRIPKKEVASLLFDRIIGVMDKLKK